MSPGTWAAFLGFQGAKENGVNGAQGVVNLGKQKIPGVLVGSLWGGRERVLGTGQAAF